MTLPFREESGGRQTQCVELEMLPGRTNVMVNGVDITEMVVSAKVSAPGDEYPTVTLELSADRVTVRAPEALVNHPAV